MMTPFFQFPLCYDSGLFLLSHLSLGLIFHDDVGARYPSYYYPRTRILLFCLLCPVLSSVQHRIKSHCLSFNPAPFFPIDRLKTAQASLLLPYQLTHTRFFPFHPPRDCYLIQKQTLVYIHRHRREKQQHSAVTGAWPGLLLRLHTYSTLPEF